MNPSSRTRCTLVCAAFISLFSIFSFRLIYLQAIKHDEYAGLAAKKHIDKQPIYAERGMVYLGGLGFADDYLKVTKKKSAGVSGRLKLVFQIALAAVVTTVFLTNPLIEVQARSLYLPFLKAPVITNMMLLALTMSARSKQIAYNDSGFVSTCSIKQKMRMTPK